MKYFRTILSALIILPFLACSQQTQIDKKLNSMLKFSVPTMKAQQLDYEIDRGAEIYILDTRKEEEFSISHIQNARFIDYDNFKESMLNDIPKDAKIVTYCSIGVRSEDIGEKIKAAGYDNVFNLYGGIFEWVNNDYPVYNSAQQKTDSVHTFNKQWSKYLKKGQKVW